MAGCGSSEAPARESAIGRTCSVRPKVVNIMDALKKSMQTGGQAKVRDAVRVRVGNKSFSPYKGCHSWPCLAKPWHAPKGRNTLFCYPLLPLQAHWARERLKPSSFWRMAHDRPSSRRRSTWRIGGPEPFSGPRRLPGGFCARHRLRRTRSSSAGTSIYFRLRRSAQPRRCRISGIDPSVGNAKESQV